MDRSEFWALVDRTRASAGGYSDAHEEALRQELRKLPRGELVDFERHASQLLTRSYGNRLWAAAWLINDGCSDDGFDAFRGWLVGQGQAVFEAALANPDSLADYPGLSDGHVELDGMWYVARQEYERHAGTEMPDLGPPTKEEDDDEPGFDVDFEDPETMREYFPKLFARFG